MAKSAGRNKTEGTFDKLRGRIAAAYGELTGKPSSRAKGRARRARGSARTGLGRSKKASR
jgi:uncharacterized protein YjbJ (UPF0337 family)